MWPENQIIGLLLLKNLPITFEIDLLALPLSLPQLTSRPRGSGMGDPAGWGKGAGTITCHAR